jgi:hypothetical protein
VAGQQQQQQARGFRSTTTTMGLKTGIVGLPNVGKVGLRAVPLPPPPAPPPISGAAPLANTLPLPFP